MKDDRTSYRQGERGMCQIKHIRVCKWYVKVASTLETEEVGPVGTGV